MPGLLFMDEDINREPETGFLPHYGPIPTEPPPETRTGILSMPPADYGANALTLPKQYYRMENLLKPDDPAAFKQLLELLYRGQRDRRA